MLRHLFLSESAIMGTADQWLWLHPVFVLLFALSSTAMLSSVDYQFQSDGAICSRDYFGALVVDDCQQTLSRFLKSNDTHWFKSIGETLDQDITNAQGETDGLRYQLPLADTVGALTFLAFNLAKHQQYHITRT